MIAVDLALVRASEFISSRLISFATEQRNRGMNFGPFLHVAVLCITLSLYADMNNRGVQNATSSPSY